MADDWDEGDAPAPVTHSVSAVVTPDLPEIKLFGKWSLDEVQLSDMSLSVSIIVL